VVLHANYRRRLDSAGVAGDGFVVLYTGYGHKFNDAEIEVLVHQFDDGREAVFFHAMELSEKFRKYREDYPDGWID
jgi:hypothetical protein